MNLNDLLTDQPHKKLAVDGVNFLLLGTAHVSKKSAEVVKSLIDTGEFDTVAIELDELRYQAITDENRYKNLDLISIIKNKQTGLIATNLAMSAYQNRLAEQLGVEPGAEMKQAIHSAKEHDLNLWKIDRSVGITMKRTWRSLRFTEKMNLVFGFGGFFEKEEISEKEIEKLKSGDMLESTFNDFSENSESLYKSLIDERDQFMAARLKQSLLQNKSAENGVENVLVVIGAGHLKGLTNYIEQEQDENQTINQLNTLPPKSKWVKILPWLITLIILTGFAWGFSKNTDLGVDLIKTWFIYNGILSGVGAAIAGGHPLTILSAVLAAPFTSLNPTIAAGMVAALVETMIRKPKIHQFEALQQDAMHLKGWWKNPVTRVLLVFLLTNLGSAVATWVSGFKIFNQLI
ncbi:TraB/GumN family protein [Marinicella marina]|uniref:TraB/GumN family protein n=1 Tax=Marinicella marina TaxID=2996016 RepID=UPI0024BC66FA|nr:TraB/GumN family protein [Marinicella marina]